MPNEADLMNLAASLCVVPIDLNVAPGFTGRVVVHLEDGRQICNRRLNENDHIGTVRGFIELLTAAGWKIEPPAGEAL